MWTTSSTHYSPLSAAGTPTTSYSKTRKKKHARQKCVDVYLGGMLAILIISFRLWTLWTGSVADGTVANERAIYAKQKKKKINTITQFGQFEFGRLPPPFIGVFV